MRGPRAVPARRGNSSRASAAEDSHRAGEFTGDDEFRAAGFFALARTPSIAGRAFGDGDSRPEARVVISMS